MASTGFDGSSCIARAGARRWTDSAVAMWSFPRATAFPTEIPVIGVSVFPIVVRRDPERPMGPIAVQATGSTPGPAKTELWP